MSATDNTIFWIEYVIRNGGSVLRSTALDFSWWQLDLLDVYGFVLLVSICIIAIILAALKMVIKLITTKQRDCNSNKKKE